MSIKETIVFGLKCAGRKLKSASPTLLVVGGTIGLVTAGVIACRETSKELDNVLKVHKQNVQAIKDIRDGKVDLPDMSAEEYAEKKYKSHLAHVYLRTLAKLAKTYAPAIIIAVLSIIMIFGGHKILTKRHLAAVANCYAVKETLNEYRKRVAEKVGDETEKLIFAGGENAVITDEIKGENGETKFESHEGLVGPETKNCHSYIFSKDTVKEYVWDERDSDLRKFVAMMTSEGNRTFDRHDQMMMIDLLKSFGFKDSYLRKHPELLTDGWLRDNPLAPPIEDVCPIETTMKLISGPGEPRMYEITFNPQGNIQDALKIMKNQKKQERKAARKAAILSKKPVAVFA